MNVLTIRCPNCNADLDIENGIDSFYCKYCGTRIILSGQSDSAIKTKSINQLANRYLDQREENLKRRAEEKAKEAEFRRAQEEKASKETNHLLIGLGIFFILCLLISYLLLK